MSRRLVLIPALLTTSWLASCGLHIGGFGWSRISHQEQAEKEVTLALELGQGDTLELASPYGGIDVTASDDGKSEVIATVTAFAETEEEAQRLLERVHLRTVQAAGRMAVEIDMPELGRGQGVGIGYRATVPESTGLRCRTGSGSITCAGPLGPCDLGSGFGDITLQDASGDVRANSGSGAIAVAAVSGTRVDVTSSYGDVTLRDARAEVIRAKTSSGNVRAESLDAGQTEISTGYGSVRVSGSRGDLTVATSSGNVTLEAVGKAAIRATTSYGKVEIEEASGTVHARSASGAISVRRFAGEADVESGYGNVKLGGVLHKVRAVSSSGDVTVEADSGSVAGNDWHLGSGYGRLVLAVPADFGAELEATTGYGEIRTGPPVTIRASRIGGGSGSSLRGTIGEGGGKLTMKTGSGSIAIRTGEK